MSSAANRRDHYLPQGYLKGFIHPSRLDHQRPLWHFDVHTNIWSERSSREVGYRLGFYDYATANVGVSADSSFADLERDYPRVRGQLISSNFQAWKDHRNFLLRFVQMMRARSLLFFDQKRTEGKNLRAFVVEEVASDQRSFKVRSMTPSPLPNDFIRNWTVTEMRTEIQKGIAWLNDFNWALRYCESPTTPFILSEIPVIAHGRSSNLEAALRDPETLLFFPLCWQACLIGSRQRFDVETGKFLEEDMRTVRHIYRGAAEIFVLSPSKLDDL